MNKRDRPHRPLRNLTRPATTLDADERLEPLSRGKPVSIKLALPARGVRGTLAERAPTAPRWVRGSIPSGDETVRISFQAVKVVC